MPDTLVRLGVLTLVALLIAGVVLLGRLFVARQRQLALSAAPLETFPDSTLDNSQHKVRILAFSSTDCTQCHTLQAPALRKLQDLRGSEIEVVEIDAPTSPELTRRYRILTVPSTVILSASGEARAVNYGFADADKLQEQIDALLIPA